MKSHITNLRKTSADYTNRRPSANKYIVASHPEAELAAIWDVFFTGDAGGMTYVHIMFYCRHSNLFTPKDLSLSPLHEPDNFIVLLLWCLLPTYRSSKADKKHMKEKRWPFMALQTGMWGNGFHKDEFDAKRSPKCSDSLHEKTTCMLGTKFSNVMNLHVFYLWLPTISTARVQLGFTPARCEPDWCFWLSASPSR